MRFAEPLWLQLLWLLPVLLLFAIWSGRRRERDLARWCSPELLQRMAPGQRPWVPPLQTGLLLAGFFFLALTAARPQVGSRVLQVKRSGIDVIVALDVSESMLAEDLKPNRITRARQEIQSLFDRLRGDRVGLVAFAGDAFVQCPLTLDYASARMFLRFMDTDLIPTPGTAIARAIEVATDAFDRGESKFKALVLITDGEDHEGKLEAATQKAKEAGVKIFAVGIGTQKGEPIPIRDAQGNLKDYKRDGKGEVVLTRCDPAALDRICRDTGGGYIDGSSGGLALDRLHAEIEAMEERELEGGVVTQYEDRYGYFAAAAFVLLALEWMLFRRRRLRLPVRAGVTVVALVSAVALASAVDLGTAQADEGQSLYENGKYEEARALYETYTAKHPEDPRGEFNLGTTLHQTGELDPAVKALQRALAAEDPSLQARALYNLGNTQAKAGDLQSALDSYKAALRLDPKDADAKHNLELVDRLLRQQPPDSSSQNQQQNQDKNQQKNQDQQNQDQNQENEDQSQQNQDQDQNQDQQQQDQKDSEQPDQPQDSEQQDPNQGDQPQDQKDPKEQESQQQESGDQQQEEQQQSQQSPGEESPEEKEPAGATTETEHPPTIPPEEARRILQALAQQETSLQEERMKAKARATNVEKDW